MQNSQYVVKISYCPRCRWLARAAWYAQEILATFTSDLNAVSLVPSDTAGLFQIEIGEVTVMDRAKDGFIDAKSVKQRLRDVIDPTRSLGHTDAT